MDNTEGKCRVVDASEEHVEHLASSMRPMDVFEASCLGYSPQQALLEGLKNDSATFTALDPQGVPFAMFGSGAVYGNCGYIWCLGTEGVSENAYDWLKASRKYVQELTRPYGVVFNYVHRDNHQAIKWLKFCGALFLRDFNFKNEPFYEFVITSK